MDWSWLLVYYPQLLHGLWITLALLVLSVFFGMLMAVPIGFAQAAGPRWLAWPAKAFCTFIRGTPLLVQIWFFYYGLGILFPLIPELRTSFLWPVLREGFFYAVVAFSLSYAGYEGEVMRGAFLGVPKGEIEAARAIGMSPFTLVRRIWFPRAVRLVLPTLAGETVGQLKATPLAFTITVMDLMGATNMIRQNTYRTYEPLMLVALFYMIITFIMVLGFNWLERLVPQKR
ncbi:MAG: ABC transporter permease [Rhizobiales bacterium]|nr:ABC transporter permease [Hyphomicrobiales bacterium]MBI3674123.1 ABC transporter permease [Hyphomicrobiales bacterium]